MQKVYKIIFLGNSFVGKTTLISQYLYSKTQNPTPTIGVDFLNSSLDVNGQRIRIQLWDTAGQERFHSIVGNYTRDTFLAIIVFSIDDLESMDNVEMWIKDFALSHNSIENINILVVGNKMDLKVDSFEDCYSKAKDVSEKYGAKLVTTSALDSNGIKEMASAISEFISENIENTKNDTKDKANAIVAAIGKRRCC